MKRAATLKRGKPIARGASKLSRATRLRPIGKRGREAQTELAVSRPIVLKRAGGRCERCRRRRPLDPHHKLARSQGGSHDPSNLVAICRDCHDALHAGRAADARRWIVTRGGAP